MRVFSEAEGHFAERVARLVGFKSVGMAHGAGNITSPIQE
jgi:hypothetical protein